jgi:hypothetical protein
MGLGEPPLAPVGTAVGVTARVSLAGALPLPPTGAGAPTHAEKRKAATRSAAFRLISKG